MLKLYKKKNYKESEILNLHNKLKTVGFSVAHKLFQ